MPSQTPHTHTLVKITATTAHPGHWRQLLRRRTPGLNTRGHRTSTITQPAYLSPGTGPGVGRAGPAQTVPQEAAAQTPVTISAVTTLCRRVPPTTPAAARRPPLSAPAATHPSKMCLLTGPAHITTREPRTAHSRSTGPLTSSARGGISSSTGNKHITGITT